MPQRRGNLQMQGFKRRASRLRKIVKNIPGEWHSLITLITCDQVVVEPIAQNLKWTGIAGERCRTRRRFHGGFDFEVCLFRVRSTCADGRN